MAVGKDRAQGPRVWALLHRLPLHPELPVRRPNVGPEKVSPTLCKWFCISFLIQCESCTFDKLGMSSLLFLFHP